MRNEDNFNNDPYQYIIDQLLILDYSNEEDFNALKSKLWVLDGPISDYEGLVDNDYDVPKDHWSFLLNELTFIDRYIRTLDGQLKENEATYEELVIQRKRGFISFVNTLRDQNDPSLGFKESWEMSYLSRPTILKDSLYILQKIHRMYHDKLNAGELRNPMDIVYGVTNYCIDMETKAQEGQLANSNTPEEILEAVAENTNASKEKNDRCYVLEMNRYYDEMIWLTQQVMPDLPPPPSATIPDPEWLPPVEGDPDYIDPEDPDYIEPVQPSIPNPISIVGAKIVLINVPPRRVQVGMTANDSSHKGMVITGGGYKYAYLSSETGIQTSLDGNIMFNPPTKSDSGRPDYTGMLDYDNAGPGFTDWYHAYFYITNDTDLSKSFVNLDFIGGSMDTLPSVPETEEMVNFVSLERFQSLNDRWNNLNRLREDSIQDNGTRSMLEASISAVVPDLKPDMEDALLDRKNQKDSYTKTLREYRPEFI